MNIVIQGRQGCGKTTTAEHITMMYHSDRIAWVNNYPAKKLCFDTVLTFLREQTKPKNNSNFNGSMWGGNADKALIVFDEIPDNTILNSIVEGMNAIKKQFPFVDTLFIVQFEIKIL